MKPIIAQHWMLNAWDVAPAKLEDTTGLLMFCNRLIKALDMKPLGTPQVYDVKGEGTAWGPGITILYGISDSSITLHTLSQYRRLYLDIFSCRSLPCNTVRGLVRNHFGLKDCSKRNYKTRLIRREMK